MTSKMALNAEIERVLAKHGRSRALWPEPDHFLVEDLVRVARTYAEAECASRAKAEQEYRAAEIRHGDSEELRSARRAEMLT